MGCASSKQARLDRKKDAMATRSYSFPHGSSMIRESYHVVSLKSSTLGALEIDANPVEQRCWTQERREQPMQPHRRTADGITDLVLNDDFQAKKAWSDMIGERIGKTPRTPSVTPSNEPEHIDAWEMMKELEDASPLHLQKPAGGEEPVFSFHTPFDPEIEQSPSPKQLNSSAKLSRPKPDSAESFSKYFDPEILASFRTAVEDMSVSSLPSPDVSSKKGSPEKVEGSMFPSEAVCTGIVKARVSDFQKQIEAKRLRSQQQALKFPPQGEQKVVLYLTTLRGVRKTYENCSVVRVILKGYGVRIDERDMSMHRRFREELDELLGEEEKTLPRLFVKGRYVGGAEDVRQLHENGELEKWLQECEKADGTGACDACGDTRFMNCPTCYGSVKVYDARDGRFQKCPACNENGIVRCPICCA